MTTRKLYSLYVDLYENGSLKDVRDFTDEERDAICMEIEEIWVDHYRFETHRRDFVATIGHDDDIIYLIAYENGRQCAFPEDCTLREITIGAPKKNEQTLRLMGDRIPLRIPGRRMSVIFSDI
jgi:hypothetical protein